MYAVIKTGGKQYRVQPGDVIVVEKIDGDAGAAVNFGEVLMLGGDKGGSVGAPLTDGAAVATALTDTIEDGLSLVYSFFDTGAGDRSLGTYMVLDHIRRAKLKGLPFVYLGYWVADCRKMAYKMRFRPLEALGMDGWERVPV